ncbi:hypothetical protein L4D77_20325 [Photobacterium frigidiphilum]
MSRLNLDIEKCMNEEGCNELEAANQLGINLDEIWVDGSDNSESDES